MLNSVDQAIETVEEVTLTMRSVTGVMIRITPGAGEEDVNVGSTQIQPTAFYSADCF